MDDTLSLEFVYNYGEFVKSFDTDNDAIIILFVFN